MSEIIELGKPTLESRMISIWRKGETMLAALGLWYLAQILGIVPIINVAVPEEVQEIPQAKMYHSK